MRKSEFGGWRKTPYCISAVTTGVQWGLREVIAPLVWSTVLSFGSSRGSSDGPEWVQWRGTLNQGGRDLGSCSVRRGWVGMTGTRWRGENWGCLWAGLEELRDTCCSLWGHYQGYWGRLSIKVLRGKQEKTSHK